MEIRKEEHMKIFEEIRDFCRAYGRQFPDHMHIHVDK